MKNHNNELVATSNQNVEKDDRLIDRQEVLAIMKNVGINVGSNEKKQEILSRLDVKKITENNKKYYSYKNASDLAVYLKKEEEKRKTEIAIAKQSNKIASSHSLEVVASANLINMENTFSHITKEELAQFNNLFYNLIGNINNGRKERDELSKTVEEQQKLLNEKDKIIEEKDEEIKELREIINLTQEKGTKKELQKKFSDYVRNQCKLYNLNYSDVFTDLYDKLKSRYHLDFSIRKKNQSIIEYIASLQDGKKYLNELLDITMLYFIDK